MKEDPFRKPGVIENVKHYFEDHVDQMTNFVFVKYDDFGTQGFGGYALGKKGEDLEKAYSREICATFGVRKMEQLVGKRCIALFAESGWNSVSVGLEDEETGKRFTIRGFLRRNLPGYKDESAYDKKLEELNRDRNRLRANLLRIEDELSEIAANKKLIREWDE